MELIICRMEEFKFMTKMWLQDIIIRTLAVKICLDTRNLYKFQVMHAQF